MIEIRYPEMRIELMEYLGGLSDVDYQLRVWVNEQGGVGVHDELDCVIHFIYDDTPLAKDPYSAIGWYLRSDEEAFL